MATITVEADMLEKVLKQTIESALSNQREMIEEAVIDAMEEMGLARAMEEKTGESVSEKTIFEILDTHATSV